MLVSVISLRNAYGIIIVIVTMSKIATGFTTVDLVGLAVYMPWGGQDFKVFCIHSMGSCVSSWR